MFHGMMTPFKVVIILKGVTQGRQVISGAGTLLPTGLIEAATCRQTRKTPAFLERRNGNFGTAASGKKSSARFHLSL
jgi:hypothetical protein